MLTTKHECYSILYDKEQQGVDVTEQLKEVVNNVTPKLVVRQLIERNDPVVEFYTRLNTKAHKIRKEILTCEGKDVATYIKIATSIITQSVIALEHMDCSVQEQNHFVNCLGITDLADGISTYYKTGDFIPLTQAVERNKQDVKSILD